MSKELATVITSNDPRSDHIIYCHFILSAGSFRSIQINYNLSQVICIILVIPKNHVILRAEKSKSHHTELE